MDIKDSDFERIDGVIRSIRITDNGKLTEFVITGSPMRQNGLILASIEVDRAKLDRFGVLHILLIVKDGEHSRIWREIINGVSFEHVLPDHLAEKMQEVKDRKYTIL